MIGVPASTATKSALAEGQRVRVARAAVRRSIRAMTKDDALERAAALVEGERPPECDGMPVRRLLLAIPGCGVTKMGRVLALAAEHLTTSLGHGWAIDEDTRLERLTPRQAWALALALRDVREFGWSA